MKIELYNRSRGRIPRQFIQKWINACERQMKARKLLAGHATLTVVLVSSALSRKLNKKYRQKNYATDVLSFSPVEPESLGELVLCFEVLKRQAKEHELSFRHELGYMLLHGILHLLGFDHENSKAQAQEMFKIQDEIFERLIARL